MLSGKREDCLGLCLVRGLTDPEIFRNNDLSATKGGLRRAYADLTWRTALGDFSRVVVYATVDCGVTGLRP